METQRRPLAIEQQGQVHPDGYMSTYCLHGRCTACASREGVDADNRPFARRPSQCKLCAAPCICQCHELVHA